MIIPLDTTCENFTALRDRAAESFKFFFRQLPVSVQNEWREFVQQLDSKSSIEKIAFLQTVITTQEVLRHTNTVIGKAMSPEEMTSKVVMLEKLVVELVTDKDKKELSGFMDQLSI